jgi:hypothetical protein
LFNCLANSFLKSTFNLPAFERRTLELKELFPLSNLTEIKPLLSPWQFKSRFSAVDKFNSDETVCSFEANAIVEKTRTIRKIGRI